MGGRVLNRVVKEVKGDPEEVLEHWGMGEGPYGQDFCVPQWLVP